MISSLMTEMNAVKYNIYIISSKYNLNANSNKTKVIGYWKKMQKYNKNVKIAVLLNEMYFIIINFKLYP